MRIVPWIAAAWASIATGCVFHADDGSRTFACSDGVCPDGEVCMRGDVCAPAPDPTAMVQTCANPEPVAAGGKPSGATLGRANNLDTTCAGMKMPGPDNVFVANLAVGDHLKAVLYPHSTSARIYALGACIPESDTCVGDVVGTEHVPLEFTVTFAPQYIVVDSTDAGEVMPFSFDLNPSPM